MHLRLESEDGDEPDGYAGEPVRPQSVQQARCALAKWLYWIREIRPDFRGALYGEPAWDLLLDLYIREKSGARSSVTAACIGSRAPHTTALRYVAALCDAGWVERVADEADKRRFWLSLSPETMNKLDRYFDRLLDTLDQPSGAMALVDLAPR